jgi:glycosyltransferase involved in cell wall biosynthesis
MPEHTSDSMSQPRIDVYAAADATDPSVRTRVTAWRDRTGLPVDLHVGRLLPTRTNDRRSGATTIVFRNAARTSRGNREARLLSRSGLGIYELDDGLPWDNGRLPGLGRWWKVPFRRDRIAARASASADRIIAGNELLADWATGRCDDVRLIPTCIEPADYDTKHTYEVSGVPTLVWIGSQATEVELTRIAPSLVEVHRLTGAQLLIVGATSRQTDPLLTPFTRRVPWSIETQRHELAKADVGLMPLTDDIYRRAKCGYKLLQYAAAGLPAVASPVGVNATMLDHGLGESADSADDWVDQLVRLLSSTAQARRELGQRARRVCVDEYSYARWETAWRQAVSP